MLSDDEKARLKEEERLRNEIRKELAPPPSQKNPLVGFLNSAFGLWMLSAIFISGVGTVYTNHQNAAQEAAKKAEAERLEVKRIQELTDRLALEISFRLSSTLTKLRDADLAYGTTVTPAVRKAIREAMAPMAFPMSDLAPPLFPEFKSYSGVALVAELRRHVADGEKKRIKERLPKASILIYQVVGQSGQAAHTPRAVASLLLEYMQDPRWDNGFPYTDCKAQKPFC